MSDLREASVGDGAWTPRHEAIANGAAKGFWVVGQDHEDLVQEARIGVLKAMRQWQPGRP